MRSMLAALVLVAGCDVADEPATVQLYVAHVDDCAAHEPMMLAVHWWASVGADLVPGGCTVSDFPAAVDVYVHPDGTKYTGDLHFAADDLPVFVVDDITKHDTDGSILTLDGLGMRTEHERAIAVVNTRPFILGHEIGHVLNLDHDNRPGNLMSIYPAATWWLDEDQIDQAR